MLKMLPSSPNILNTTAEGDVYSLEFFSRNCWNLTSDVSEFFQSVFLQPNHVSSKPEIWLSCSSPEIVEISHQTFLSSSRVYSCNQITFLPSQKYGCHVRSQLQQLYGPSCNIFETFVASASRSEDFLGAFSSLAWIAYNFFSVSTVCFLSFLCSYDAVVFSLLTKFIVVVVLRTGIGKTHIYNTAALKTDSIPKLRHTVMSLSTETYIYHQKPDDSQCKSFIIDSSSTHLSENSKKERTWLHN